MMPVIIPTRGRPVNQITIKSFPVELRKRTTIVCPAEEVPIISKLDPLVDVISEPSYIRGIGDKRAWIIRNWHTLGYNKILMVDDDLWFQTRKTPGSTKLTPISGMELIPEINLLEEKCGPEFPNVGFGTRPFNNTQKDGWRSPGRTSAIIAHYLPITTTMELGRIRQFEDTDLVLQLLRKGYPNAVYDSTVQDTKIFTDGGCNTWRTAENYNEDLFKLARFHPDYVGVIPRSSSPRHHTVIKWKLALKDGKRDRHARVP
jgi:hypothetical protein